MHFDATRAPQNPSTQSRLSQQLADDERARAHERQAINEMRQQLRHERNSQSYQREKDAYDELRMRSSNLRSEFFKAEHTLLGLLDLMHEHRAELELVTSDLAARHEKLYKVAYTGGAADLSMIETPVVLKSEVELAVENALAAAQVAQPAPAAPSTRSPTLATAAEFEPIQNHTNSMSVLPPAMSPEPHPEEPEIEPEEEHRSTALVAAAPAPVAPAPLAPALPETFEAHVDHEFVAKELANWSLSQKPSFFLRQLRYKRDKSTTLGCTKVMCSKDANGKNQRCSFKLYYAKIGPLSGWALMPTHCVFTHHHGQQSVEVAPEAPLNGKLIQANPRKPVLPADLARAALQAALPVALPVSQFKRVRPLGLIDLTPNVDRQGKRPGKDPA